MKKFLSLICACMMILCPLSSCAEKNPSENESSTIQELDEAVLKPIHDYLDGYNAKDAELVLSSFVPQLLISEMKEKGTYENEIERVKGNIDATFELWEENYGADSSISFGGEVSNSTLSEEYLELASKYFELTFYDLDTKIELEQGYEVSYTYTIKGEHASTSDTQKACHVKVRDGEWVLLFCDAETLESFRDIPDEAETGESSETDITE